MNFRPLLVAALGLASLLPASLGCATIISGTHSKVQIKSNVPDSQVTIQDRKGKSVASGYAPGMFKLDRGYNMLLPARYTATVDAPGYEPQQVEIKSNVNPWILGNVVLGGVVGLVADDASGAMWKPKHDTYQVNLRPSGVAYQAAVAAAYPPGQPPMYASGTQYRDDTQYVSNARYSGNQVPRYPVQQSQYYDPLR